MTSPTRYSRILLKLSGEALLGRQQYGVDPQVVAFVAEQVRRVRDLGVNRTVENDMLHQHAIALTNTMRAVLGLGDIGGDIAQFCKHYSAARRQRMADAHRLDAANDQATIVVGLKPAHRRITLVGRIIAVRDLGAGKRGGDLVNNVAVMREADHLQALFFDHLAQMLDHV